MKKAAIFIALAMILLLSVGGCRRQPKPREAEEPRAKFIPATKPSAVAGQRIYQANCAACHGPGGAGDGPKAPSLPEKPKDFTDEEFMRGEQPQEFYEAVTEGKGQVMPAFKKKLSAQARWDALFFAWSRSTSPARIAAGREIYTKHCVACHGKNGDGRGLAGRRPEARPPRLDDPRFMMQAESRKFYDAVTKGKGAMPWFARKLNDDQRWQVVEYTWTFVYEPPAE